MSLHDIPLKVAEQQGDSESKKQKVSKTNSLRRFFKLPSKKSLENMEKENNQSQADIEAGIPKEEEPQEKRYHLRVGGSSENAAAVIDRESGSHTLGHSASRSPSRPTLRGSISSYWNTVFKRTPKRGSSPSNGAEASNSSDEEFGATNRNVEEVHNLPVSEDTESVTAQALTQKDADSQSQAEQAARGSVAKVATPSKDSKSPNKPSANRSRSSSPPGGKGKK